MAMQFAHAARIPEMVQAIFYAMAVSDVVELRLSSRDAMGDMIWDIVEAWLLSIDERFRDTQIPRLVEMVYNPRPCSEVTSRLRDAPPLSGGLNSVKKGPFPIVYLNCLEREMMFREKSSAVFPHSSFKLAVASQPPSLYLQRVWYNERPRQSPPPASGVRMSYWPRAPKVILVLPQVLQIRRPRWPLLALAVPQGKHLPLPRMGCQDVRLRRKRR
ncbi:hypothetical protein Cgig2_023662 [Carnegiea gigantea]|uniref:Uncharacterized protein n=1 Tax=Carnegiea gigantea TaxID=171969 RepID=A0A9Q1QK06_9CARY|nr:hypothetical protein Cgig2_023662 [Carnegiea gigantea]